MCVAISALRLFARRMYMQSTVQISSFGRSPCVLFVEPNGRLKCSLAVGYIEGILEFCKILKNRPAYKTAEAVMWLLGNCIMRGRADRRRWSESALCVQR